MKRFAVGSAVVCAVAALATASYAEPSADASSKVMTYVKAATSKNIKSMNEPGVEAFFEDVVSSNDPKAPISCALFRIKKSEPLKYDYDYDDAKIVLEGEITVADGKSTVTATKGDVLLFPKGSTITFSSESEGLAFACGQRPKE